MAKQLKLLILEHMLIVAQICKDYIVKEALVRLIYIIMMLIVCIKL
jgi:hypothetical protein